MLKKTERGPYPSGNPGDAPTLSPDDESTCPVNVFVRVVCRRGEILFAATVHGQAVPASPRSDNRGGVRGAHDQHRQPTDEAADLGHGEE